MICARITDMHVCPMFSGPVPHVGGPVLPPGVPTVLVGMLPCAVVGTMALCAAGPPDVLVKGSGTVLVGARPCVRLGMDPTAHGGVVAGPGCPTVIVGG